MLLYIGIAGLVVLTIGFTAVVLVLSSIQEELQRMNVRLERIKSLQLNPRTRIGSIAPQSGATTQEQQLSKLGRASSARRVVVGGDPDSQLHSDLTATLEEEESHG